ncbi:MAG: glycosyltransferase family 4 protein [Chitinispirillaceae bacterium]|nr:glycosyltransferase family 4 protein [Chitinispirillaceae bacterium]
MNVLVTLDFPPETGGIQRYLADIVAHTFTAEDLVITGGRCRRQRDDEHRYPCRIIRVPHLFLFVNKKIQLLQMLVLLWYQVVRRWPQVTVFAGNIYAALVPALISLGRPLRYHIYCYGTELLPLKKKCSLRGLIWRTVLRRCTAVYYLTKTTLELLKYCRGCAPCERIPPRIDLPDYQVCRKEPREGIVRLLSVGRLVPHKGHAVLIAAVSLLKGSVPWNLTIVGEGPEFGRLGSLVRRYGLENHVFLAGSVSGSELAGCYKAADIFVFPSMETVSAVEGFGIVLLEAMAYGAAIVACRSGGIAEVVDNNNDYAVLVPPDDPEALKNGLMGLMIDGKRRYRMACAARRFLEERYVWKEA